MKLLQKFIFGLLLFNEVICTACSINTPTCTKFIWCSYYRSLIDTLASEVKCLRVIKRRDLSNERNTFKSKTIFYHKKTRLKPERATRPIPKRRRPLYATATRPIPKRRRPLYATATRSIPKRRRPLYATATQRPSSFRDRPCSCRVTQILNLSNLRKGSDIKRTSRRTVLLKGSDIKRTSRRTVLLKGSDIKRTSRRTVLLKGSDIKRTSRRTALLKGRNTRTIQLPLRHLKGIGIGMTPLSDWLNVLPRGSGIAWVTELPLPPKGMSWHVVLH